MTQQKMPAERIHALMVEYLNEWDEAEIAEVILEANSYRCYSSVGGYAWGDFFHLNPKKQEGARYLVVCGIFNGSDEGIRDADWLTCETKRELIEAALEEYYMVTEYDEPRSPERYESMEPQIANLLSYELQFEQAE